MQQDALAHEAGLHAAYLSGIENGWHNATLEVLEKLAWAAAAEAELVLRHDRGE